MFALTVCSIAFSQKYDLKLNLNKGENYEFMQVVDMDMKQNFQGQEIPVKISAQLGLMAKVIAKTGAGYNLECSYKYISTGVDAMGNKINLNTQDNSDNPVAASLKKLVNRKFNVEITEKGKVTKISGNKEIIEQLSKEIADMGPSKDKFLQLYADDAITQTFEIIYNFPPNPVQKGENWKSTFVTNNGYKVNNQVTYTLESIDDRNYNIKYVSDVSTFPAQVMEENGMKMMPDLKGTVDGLIILNKNNGWISSMTSTGKMNGEITMVDMGGIKVQMDMTTKMNYYPQSEPKSPPPPMDTKK